MRWSSVLPLSVALAGCFNPSDPSASGTDTDAGSGTETASSTGPSTSATMTATTTATMTATATATMTATTTATATETDDETTDATDPGTDSGETTSITPAECADGSVDPGELCWNDYQEVEVGYDPLRIEAVDLNGNGHLDLIMGSTGRLSSSLGAGDGTFADAAVSQPASGGAFTVALVDDDAIPDVIFAVAADRWGVSFGDGVGNIATPAWDIYGNSAYATDFVAGDFGGPGDTDIAVVFPFLQSARFVSSTGMAPPASTGEIYIGEDCGSIIAPNLTGGALPNIAMGCENGDLVIASPLGDGSFGSETFWTVGGAVSGLASCDFNGDGNLDIAVANREGDTATVFLGDGVGAVDFPPEEIDVGSAPNAIACADMNNDGNDDIVTVNLGDQSVSIILGLGARGFENFPETLAVNEANRRDASDVALADINEDGTLDIVVANAYHDASQAPIEFPNVGLFLSNP